MFWSGHRVPDVRMELSTNTGKLIVGKYASKFIEISREGEFSNLRGAGWLKKPLYNHLGLNTAAIAIYISLAFSLFSFFITLLQEATL